MKRTHAPPSFPESERRALGRAIGVVIDRRLAARMETDNAMREVVGDLLARIERLEALSGIDDAKNMEVRRVTPFRPRPTKR